MTRKRLAEISESILAKSAVCSFSVRFVQSAEPESRCIDSFIVSKKRVCMSDSECDRDIRSRSRSQLHAYVLQIAVACVTLLGGDPRRLVEGIGRMLCCWYDGSPAWKCPRKDEPCPTPPRQRTWSGKPYSQIILDHRDDILPLVHQAHQAYHLAD